MSRQISKSVRQVLGTLAAAKGPMTRRQVANKVAVTDKVHAGRIADESLTYNGLVASGDISEIELDDETGYEMAYKITAKGRKLLEAASK